MSLLALDEAFDPEHESVPRGLLTTVTLTQALGDADTRAPLWILTTDAQMTSGTDAVSGLDQATVWGLARVLATEIPQRWGGIVDLPAAPDATAITLLGRILAGADVADQWAVRGARTLTRRLTRTSISENPAWEPSGTVLITGGTGALGAHVARGLATHGAEHLVLLSRQGMDAPGATALRDELAACGAAVTVVGCDIGDRAALNAVLDQIPDQQPLTAVVHAAGQLDDSTIDKLTPDQMNRALRAKLLGAVNLHEATRNRDLSAFVLFSSLAGTFGSFGQSNYAPGNAYLDALAAQRRAMGLPAISIAWGPWAGAGMSAALRRVEEWNGVPALAVDRALAALHRVVHHPDPNVVVAEVDWPFWHEAAGADTLDPMYRSLTGESGGGPDRKPDRIPALRARVEAAPAAEREQLLLEAVRRIVGSVLGHDSPAAIDADRAFRDLGFDSLAAVELRNRLAAETGLRLPPAVVFDHPTVRDLVRYLLDGLAVPVMAEELSFTDQLDRLEVSLGAAATGLDQSTRLQWAARLQALAIACSESDPTSVAADLESATDEDLFDFIRTEFGRS
ncbi:SDR family NAD(P)-dependent oxidoreductase [Nocardia sp. NPDC056952]|uniref:type I polyketide synthase n=1 Tax=Nocardia sp. NPDC056952 TaxID=3345979 RepID=UPI00362D2514